MNVTGYLLVALFIGAIAGSLALTDEDREDDLDTDADDEDIETVSPVATPVENACPRAFREGCTCGRSTVVEGSQEFKRYVLNCTDQGYRDATALRSMPIGTEILIFTGNNLTEGLPQNLFGNNPNRQYEKLRVINLSNNQISAIHGKTFHNVRNVTKLILDNNKLLITGTHFHSRVFTNFLSLEELYLRNAFGEGPKGENFMEDLITMLTNANLDKLRVLRLDNNTIQTIPTPDVFCSMEQLQYLHLSQNVLIDAKVNTSCFRRLKMLDISDNFIVNLSNETLAMFERPKGVIFHVNLTRNPFRCDCEFLDFWNWMHSTNTWVVGNKNFRCASGYPEKNIGKVISYLKASDFQCPQANAEEMSGYATASYAVLISLTVALLVLISVLMVSNREHLATCWTFLSKSFASKREYTSLEQENKRVQQASNGDVEEAAV